MLERTNLQGYDTMTSYLITKDKFIQYFFLIYVLYDDLKK